MIVVEIPRRLFAGAVLAACFWAIGFAGLATNAAPPPTVTTGTPAP